MHESFTKRAASFLSFTQHMWFWILVAFVASALIFRSECRDLVVGLVDHYEYQIEIERLEEDFKKSQIERDYWFNESRTRQDRIDGYEIQMRDMDFELLQEKNQVQQDIQGGRVENRKLGAVTMDTLSRIDQMAAELP